jgi:hypothetical protein
VTVGLDRSLDEEGIPDLEGPLPQKVATGDPQEGASPPSDRPAAADYGTTAREQSRPEPLDARLARELPDDESEIVGRASPPETGGLSAEEAAIHESLEA